MIWLTKKPFRVDFIDNNPIFSFHPTSYKVWCQFLVTRTVDDRSNYLGIGNHTETLRSPEMLLDNTSGATLDCRILKSYYLAPDIDSLANTEPSTMKYPYIFYQLDFAEVHPDGTMGAIKHSDNLIMLNGGISSHKQISNEPDWNVPDWAGKISSQTWPFVIGMPSGKHIRAYRDTPLWLYVANFSNIAKDISLNVEVSSSVEMTFDKLIGLAAGRITRIPLVLNEIAVNNDLHSSVYSYRVSLASPHGIFFETTVDIINAPAIHHDFLLQNRLGLLETFSANELALERATEGKEVVINGDNDVDFDSVTDTFTLRTGAKSDSEMILLANAVIRNGNYIVRDDVAYQVNFLPTTLQVADDGEDIHSAEVKFTVGKPTILTSTIYNQEDVIEDSLYITDNINFQVRI